jgi:hypothetical protein
MSAKIIVPLSTQKVALIWDGNLKTIAFLAILSHFASFLDPSEFPKTHPTQAKASTIHYIWQERGL